MPNVAFYRVVSDTKVLEFPSGGNPKELEFKATGDIVVDTSSARPMVCFQMDASPNNAGMARSRLELFIRDKSGADRRICAYDIRDSIMRWTMEPFDPAWIRKGDNEVNKLIFNVDVDAGSFAIRNVVVWFMRDIQ